MSKIRFRDVPLHTRSNFKVVLRSIPHGFAEAELRVLLGSFNDHIKWLQYLPDIGQHTGTCFLQLDSETEMVNFLRDFNNQKFFDGKGCEFVTHAEVALHQKVSEAVSAPSPTRVEDSKCVLDRDFQDFAEKYKAGTVDYYQIITDAQNVTRMPALVQSLNEERRKAAEERKKPQTKPGKTFWRKEQKPKRWVKKTTAQ